MHKWKLRVNPDRLWASLMSMADVGALPGGGCRRLALSAEDQAGRDLFVSWCRDAGCTITVDAIGNIFARRPGRNSALPAVATGSHLDTQPHGGRFDGVYGVLAGLEVIRTLNDARLETEAPIDVVVWTNEEGSRFSPPLTGSRVFVGQYSLEEMYLQKTSDSSSVREDLSSIGYLGQERPGARAFSCYIEAHIEQGPILESNKVNIGVVTGVQGIRWLEVLVNGQDAHAGTVPMSMRKDALVGAAEMVVALNALAVDGDPATRLTVGRFCVSPNSGSTIPGSVRFTVDLRHPSAESLDRLVTTLRSIVVGISRSRTLQATVSEIMTVPPVVFDRSMLETVRAAAALVGVSHQEVLSGAGHDAMNIAACCPVGMIFIPCKGGLSHNEAEWASADDVAAGANVLLQAVLACPPSPSPEGESHRHLCTG